MLESKESLGDSAKPRKRDGRYYERRRQEVERVREMPDDEKIAFLKAKIRENAQKILETCHDSSEIADEQRVEGITAVGVYAEAAVSIAEPEAVKNAHPLECPPWLTYARYQVEEFVHEEPDQRGILLQTALFDRDLEQELNRMVFRSTQGPVTSMDHAIGLIAGQVTISF